MATSLLKETLQAVEDLWFFGGDFRNYKGITDPQGRLQTLAHLERPGWKEGSYKVARRLREAWGLSLEPDTQAAIAEFFIGVNTSHWERVVLGQGQILDFLRLGAKDALGEVAENLHKQWEQGIPVVERLIGGRTDVQTMLAWYGLGIPDIKDIVGITEDQPVGQQIARLLDPYFEQGRAFEIGKDLCRGQGIPTKEGVSLGIRWGFVKRNTIDFARKEDQIQRQEIVKWLNDDARVDEALRRLTGNLELSYSVVAVKKLC